jgi:SSS family solute:Na+ symporter
MERRWRFLDSQLIIERFRGPRRHDVSARIAAGRHSHLLRKASCMETLDWVVVAGYFFGLLALAWWVIRQGKETADDYFLAGRHLGWFIVGASIFASNIGSEHLVGLAGSGATNGVIFAHYELHAWCLLVLAWILIPFYMRSMVYTMPEFLERRFSASSRLLLSVISLIAYVLTKIAVGIFAGGVVFRVLLPDLQFTVGETVIDSFWIGSILVIVMTGVYTVLGGFRAVAYTEAIQTLVLILGSVLVTVYGLKELGGWSELRRICGPEMFNLWQPMMPENVQGVWAPIQDLEGGKAAWYFDNGVFPWVGMLFCAPIIGLWYWCTDQYIVQRCLGARDETQARRGSIFAAFLKLLPVFIFIIPGLIAFALAKSGKVEALAPLVGEDGKVINDRAQAAFPLLVYHVLPQGIRGIVVAGLLSALMSSLAGVFNACSTLFTIDLYQKIRPGASQARLVWIGRVATAVMVVIGLAWIPVIAGAKGLYEYLQGIQAYLAPPIFVVFFGGVFFKRLNAAGCFAALVFGFLLGLVKLGIDTPPKFYSTAAEPWMYAEGSLPWIINKIYFQYFSLLIFLVSAAVMVGVSLMTAPPNPAQLNGLTYGAVSDEDKRLTRESWDGRDVLSSLVVIGLIIAAYVYFSG